MLSFITMICWESISIMLESRMPYGRCVCDKVLDVISMCFNLYNAAFIHSRLRMKKNATTSTEQ